MVFRMKSFFAVLAFWILSKKEFENTFVNKPSNVAGDSPLWKALVETSALQEYVMIESMLDHTKLSRFMRRVVMRLLDPYMEELAQVLSHNIAASGVLYGDGDG